jgi:uncharacterized protein YbaP (TraB family)
VDWRSSSLDAALAGADSLWFELPIDDATNAAAVRLTAARARLPAGDTLWAHLSPAQRARVARAAATLGLSSDVLAPLRPWMAELTLSLADAQRAGAAVGEGVETRIQNAAPPTVRRMALETVADQVGVLAGGGVAEQIASLDETAREVVEDPDLYRRTVREWRDGDLDGLERDNLAPLRRIAPAGWRRLILDRNRRWARTLDRLAETRGHAVVVVGVGHLIGPDGVPAMLRQRGLTVEGPTPSPAAKSLTGPD